MTYNEQQLRELVDSFISYRHIGSNIRRKMAIKFFKDRYGPNATVSEIPSDDIQKVYFDFSFFIERILSRYYDSDHGTINIFKALCAGLDVHVYDTQNRPMYRLKTQFKPNNTHVWVPDNAAQHCVCCGYTRRKVRGPYGIARTIYGLLPVTSKHAHTFVNVYIKK